MEELKQLVQRNARQTSQLAGKVDEFVFQSQRILAKQGGLIIVW